MKLQQDKGIYTRLNGESILFYVGVSNTQRGDQRAAILLQ